MNLSCRFDRGSNSGGFKGEFMNKKLTFNLDSILNIEALTLSTFMLMTVMVLSCSKKNTDTNSQTPGNLIELSDSSDFKNFQVTSLVPNSQNDGYQEYLEERYGSSCRVVRNSKGQIIEKSDIRAFDPSLSNTDVVFYTVKMENQEERVQKEMSLQIRNANQYSVRLFRTTLSMKVPQAGGELFRLPLTSLLDCADPYRCLEPNPPDLGIMRSVLNDNGYNYYIKKQTLAPRTCQVQATGAIVSTIAKGKMRLHNGGEIDAYQTVESDYGPVYCNGRYMGQGESKTVSIHSLNIKPIPGFGLFAKVQPYSCGGALVAESRIIKLQDRIIDSIKFEQNQPVLK